MLDLNNTYVGMNVKLNRPVRVNAYPEPTHIYEEGKVGRILDIYDVRTGRDSYSVMDIEFEDGSCLFRQQESDYDEVTTNEMIRRHNI